MGWTLWDQNDNRQTLQLLQSAPCVCSVWCGALTGG